MLPSSDVIIKATNRIVEVFSNPAKIGVVRIKLREIKRYY